VTQDEKDPFVADSSPTADAGYSIEKFYTASRDRKGFSTTIQVHVPPTFMAELSALVQAIPEYRTSRDAIRDFLVHGLHAKREWLAGHADRANSDYLAYSQLEAALNRQQMRQQQIQTAKDLVANASGLSAMKDAIDTIEISVALSTDDHVRTELEKILRSAR
jgi:hypothetical protein